MSLELFDPATCKRMVKAVNDRKAWSAASIGEQSGDGYRSAVRSEYRSAFAYTPPFGSDIRKQFDQKVRTLIRPSVRETWRRDFKRHEGTHLVRYLPGGFYVSHVDAELDMKDRCFSIVCYLNDSFGDRRASLHFSFTPKIGRALIFPSTYLHRAEPVSAGRKYILVSWLVGADPIQWL
jgi:hypothetical protein